MKQIRFFVEEMTIANGHERYIVHNIAFCNSERCAAISFFGRAAIIVWALCCRDIIDGVIALRFASYLESQQTRLPCILKFLPSTSCSHADGAYWSIDAILLACHLENSYGIIFHAITWYLKPRYSLLLFNKQYLPICELVKLMLFTSSGACMPHISRLLIFSLPLIDDVIVCITFCKYMPPNKPNANIFLKLTRR